MAIKGLTDRGLSFPEIGQIRKGIKVKAKTKDGREIEIPKDLDYFRVEFAEAEQEAETTFRKTYGEKPTEIKIILPFNEIDRMWDPFLEAYVASRMIARSDGENVLYLVDGKTGEVLVKNGIDLKTGQRRPHPEDNLAGRDQKNQPVKYDPVGRLKVIVPELARAAYLTVHTTSYIDIANISQQLNAFAVINNGQIAGIPFMLRRRPKKISVPGKDGKRTRVSKWMLSIEADPEWVKRKLGEIKHLALPGNGFDLVPQLEAGKADVIESTAEDVTEDEGGEWEADFFEDNQPEEGVAVPQDDGKPSAAMDYETAKLVSTSKGELYGAMDAKQLSAITKSINDALKKNGLTQERREELQFKLDAAKVCLANMK